MKYKPLTLLELLDKPVLSAKLAQVELGIYAKIRKIETELNISEEVSVEDLPVDKQKDILELLHQAEVIKRQQGRFSNLYKKSVERLVEANKGLPIHINAWDIHDHNLDVDNIVETYQAVIRKDDNNYFDGNVITIDTQDSLIISPNKLTAVIGMKDVAIINVNDATLVMPIARSEEVKDIVNLLNKKKKEYL